MKKIIVFLVLSLILNGFLYSQAPPMPDPIGDTQMDPMFILVEAE